MDDLHSEKSETSRAVWFGDGGTDLKAGGRAGGDDEEVKRRRLSLGWCRGGTEDMLVEGG